MPSTLPPPTPKFVSKLPAVGQVVRVRTRTWLVENVHKPSNGSHRVQLACLHDDAQGQVLEVIWELEIDAEILDREAWHTIGRRDFDPLKFFAGYLNTLRWNCVTATNPELFQAPFRAGIKIDPYQLEPLRKALLLPRVNMFIADDVGLGKTIEAGLIARELLLRRRVRDIVVACPPSMLIQWKDELEARFGLVFEIYDREYVETARRKHGFSVNPWKTFPRFLISHKLLIDEAYAGPMRDWLDNLSPGSLLILDEAHHAAPSSGSRYAIDSKITRAIRDLAPRFEHRLFLSATPHNGHSNSFSALLELLDPQRFTRGVKVTKENLDAIMVRRLKDDIREIAGGFAKRIVEQVDVKGLPADAPELVLSKLLNQYRETRAEHLSEGTKRQQNEAKLVLTHLQQRLLSSIEAFARTLAVHRRSMERVWAGQATKVESAERDLLAGGVDADDDRAQLSEGEQQALEDRQVEAATEASSAQKMDAKRVQVERALLDQMANIAESARGRPDARILELIKWIQANQCAGAGLPQVPAKKPGAGWTDTRVILFTEYDDTKRYVVSMLKAAIANTPGAEGRIEVFHGPTPTEKREAIKRAFNLPPHQHPIRILVATDAAREGLNLQAHCHNLFHLDVPWNPSRLEQRNGRIDRKLQPKPEVFCRYFVYWQRPEDRVLQVLVKKTDVIRRELGSLAQVLEVRLADTIRGGISHAEADNLVQKLESAELDKEKRATAEEELEVTRDRREAMTKQIDGLRKLINKSRESIGLDNVRLRAALSSSLELLKAEPLKAVKESSDGPERFEFPNLDTRQGADPTWSGTLDTLRKPPEDGVKGFRWRKESPMRPVVFDPPDGIDEDVVQLHLEHRVVQRLLGRFTAQGFIYHDLSRACLAQSEDAIPRVVLIGRLGVYGAGAVRLHEEMIVITAKYVDADVRRGKLVPYGKGAESKTVEILHESLAPGRHPKVPSHVQTKLKGSVTRDIEELLPHLESRGTEAMEEAQSLLAERGKAEAESIRHILEAQKKRVRTEFGKEPADIQMVLGITDEEEKRQVADNRRYWARWLQNVDEDLKREPARIREFYKVVSHRIEPVGLAYLWPITG